MNLLSSLGLTEDSRTTDLGCKLVQEWKVLMNLYFLFTDLCGTPGYLAPEVLKVSMYDNAEGYGKAVDM